MKHYYPGFYETFRCIAADCPDSCCQGWDVVIDSDTEAFYNTVQGDFGDRLRAAVYTDSDGDRVFRLAEEKRCPFWGADKLCDIYRTLGEEHLCATCALFPRLSMDYTAFTEHTLALACPEAARLILSADNAYAGFTQETVGDCEDYDAGLMDLLLQARRESVRLLTADKPLAERLRDCWRYNIKVQNRLYDDEITSDELSLDGETLARLFSQLEYIDESSRDRFVNACHYNADFSAHEAELTRLALYFLYRYYLNAVGDGSILAPIRYMILSLRVVAGLARAENIPLVSAAQLYSKEIEQSYENMELLWDVLSG